MSYTAVVLDKQSQLALGTFCGDLFDHTWEFKCHHMTLHMGPHAPEVDPPIGERVELLALRGASDGKVAAVEVSTDVKTFNKTPHVTVAVNRENGGKPVMSNDLTDWVQLKKPIPLYGSVQECS